MPISQTARALASLHKGNQQMSAADQKSATIMSAFESVASIQRRLENKWGVGRLQDLADPSLRAKFDRAVSRFDTALDKGDPDDVVGRAAALHRGWCALQESADDGGHKPLDEKAVWAWRADNGKGYAIAKDHNSRIDALADLEDGTVWTLEEVGKILHYLTTADPLLGQIKEMFGAEVIQITKGMQKQRAPKKETFKSDKPEYDDDVPF